MNYTLSQIIDILNHPNMTIESKYLQINNSLSSVNLLSRYSQNEFYNELNNYLINNPLFSIVLTIHFPLLVNTPVENNIKHYINEYNKIPFSHYYLLDPVISNYGSEYLLDWITLINIQYFNHMGDPNLLNFSYILENILRSINIISRNVKYGEYLYNKDNTLGIIEVAIENGSLFKYVELFMINTYLEHHPVMEIIITEMIADIISGNTMDNIISANFNFLSENLHNIHCLEYDLVNLESINPHEVIKRVCTFIIANILNNIILDYRLYLGSDHNFLLYVSQLKYF